MAENTSELHPAGPIITRREAIQATAGAVALATLPHQSVAATNPPAAVMNDMTLTMTVNGRPLTLTVDPRQSLLDVLRETLDLPGTKKGCNQGACGACTILVDGKRIVSCLTLASMHDGAEIQTIEGLEKDGELHPLQEAFVKHEGLQCGFCTSGPDHVRPWLHRRRSRGIA